MDPFGRGVLPHRRTGWRELGPARFQIPYRRREKGERVGLGLVGSGTRRPLLGVSSADHRRRPGPPLIIRLLDLRFERLPLHSVRFRPA